MYYFAVSYSYVDFYDWYGFHFEEFCYVACLQITVDLSIIYCQLCDIEVICVSEREALFL